MSISITSDQLNSLHRLQQETKFSEEEFCPGAPTEEIRVRCEQRVNGFISDLISLLERGVDRGAVFGRARALEKSFGKEDTEERERVGDYIGDAMRIIGLDDWTDHV